MNSFARRLSSEGWPLRFILVVCVLVITFPGDYLATNAGLDRSWVHAVNYLSQTNMIIGRDYVHTFGPLGYLIHPLNIGSNLVDATIFRLVIHGIFAACLLFLAYAAKSTLPVLAFAVGYAISTVAVINLEFSYRLLVVQSLLFSVSLADRRLWWVAAPICAALAASILFMKFGIGIAAAGILAIATGIWMTTKRVERWKIVLVVCGSYLSVIVLLAAVYLESAHSFSLWIERSLNMSDGFVIAQSLVKSRIFLALGVLAFAVYVWMVYSLQKQKSNLRYIAPVFALAIFLAFKHGFVRQDGHARNFFPFLLAAISVVALNMETRKDGKTVTIAYVLVLALSLPVGVFYASGLLPVYQMLSGQTGYSNIASTIGLTETRNRLDRESARNLEAKRLPSTWINEIVSGRGTLDVIPWELSYIFANNLQWRPNVTLQLFNSYTALLDRWNAEHFVGSNAPDFLIVEFKAIDDRHLLLDTPAVTRSLLRNYTVFEGEQVRALAFLKRRPRPLEGELTTIGKSSIRLDEWVDVPRTDGLLFADIEFSLSSFGMVSKFIFRIPPVFVEVVHESGRKASYRITPDVARNGLLINYLPENQDELVALLNGCTKDSVVRFRINGPGTFYYAQNADLRWEQGLGTFRSLRREHCAS